MAAHLPPNYTQQDIEDELVFTKVIIDSLDPDADSYEDTKRGHEQKIEELEAMLGLSPTTQGSEFEQPFGLGDYDGFQADGGDEIYTGLPMSPALPAITLDTMSRKRPHGELASSPTETFIANKSVRPTPAASPSGTVPNTPSSENSLDLAEHAFTKQHGHQFLGVGPSETKYSAMIERQRQAEKEAERSAKERREQLEHDRRLAASLQSGSQFQSKFGKSSSQAVLNRDGTFRRPSKPGPAKTEPGTASASPFQYVPNGYSSLSMTPGPSTSVKSEFSLPQFPSPSAPSTFGHFQKPNGPSWEPRNHRGSFVGSSDESSDLEEIDAEQFSAASERKRKRSVQSTNMNIYPQVLSNQGLMTPSSVQPQRQYSLINNNNGMQFPVPDSDDYAMYQNGMPQSTPTPANTWEDESLYWTPMSDVTNTLVGGFRDNIATFRDAVGLGSPFMSNSPLPSSGMPGAFPGRAMPNGVGFISGAHNNIGLGSSRSNGPTEVIDLDEYDAERARFDYLYSDASKTTEEIKKLIENIAPGDDLPPQMREGTPNAMRLPLLEHQKVGLTWLKEKEQGSTKGGILADDMGLGKTIQAIALMVSRRSEDPLRKTTLIIAPVALMRQWEYEIKDKLKGGTDALSVIKHHGGSKKTSFKELKKYDVVLTTFGTLASELKKKERWDQIVKNNPNASATPKERLTLLGNDCLWYRIIIDEAQCIKNKSTATAKAAYLLRSQYRLCMTGTPMMNSVTELYSLIKFCRIPPYNDQDRFRHEISGPLGSQSDFSRDRAMKKLQGLIRAIMLRRTKTSMLDGKPIITLPGRTTNVAEVGFSQDERDFYTALETQSQLQFNRYLRAGTVMKNYANVLVLLLRLRQACCHPHLIRDFATGISGEVTAADMTELAKSLGHDVVQRIKQADGNFECPICYDGVQNPAIIIPCGHDTCSECFARLTDPSRNLAQGTENGDAKCPKCRGKVDAKRIIDYEAFKKVHMPELGGEGDALFLEDEAEADNDDSDDDSDSDSESDDEDDTLSGFIVADDVEDTADETEADAANSERKPSTALVKSKKGKKKSKKSGKGKGKAKDKATKTLAQLRVEGTRNKKAKRKYMRRLAKDWITSAKIDKTMELLAEIHQGKDREKVLIFSQFTSLLDLLEIAIQKAGYQHTRYDGSMSATDRNDAVMKFKETSNCRIMLISLKAGNAGLNLNCASQVIILDPFWNPYIEEQAIDRAHRIGQMKPVTVNRIVVAETVEDRILKLQDKKRALISAALDENAGKSVARLGERELGYLFGNFRNPERDN